MPIVKRLFGGFRDYICGRSRDADDAAGGREARAPARARAIGHALAFATWRSLTREQGLDDLQAAELMVSPGPPRHDLRCAPPADKPN